MEKDDRESALEAQNESVNDQIDSTPCPACGAMALRIEMRLEAKPLGTFSIAGAQMKTVATQRPWLVCDNCGVEAKGS